MRRDVCFTPETGHWTDIPGGPFGANNGHCCSLDDLVRTAELYGAFMLGLAALELTRAGGVVTWRGRKRRPPWVGIAVGLSLW